MPADDVFAAPAGAGADPFAADRVPADPVPADSAPGDLFAEARRQLSVCNACRYCAGYCPVWPELELRSVLTDGDLGYLANLCHDCQDCFTACMYTAPHEFAINPPRVFAALRADSYRRYAWPRQAPARQAPARRADWNPDRNPGQRTGRNPDRNPGQRTGRNPDRNPGQRTGRNPNQNSGQRTGRNTGWLAGWRGAVAAVAAVAAVLIGVSAAATGRLLSAGAGPGDPYQILPYPLLLVLLGLPALWCAGALAAGVVRCWRDIHGRLADLASARLWPRALAQAVQLRHMRGGGAGCDYPADAPSPARRWFHLTLGYGFGLCVASTVAAAVEQDLAKIAPPYPYLSVPVVAGALGGLGMVAGGAGLLVLKARSDAARTTGGMRRADFALLLALLVLAASGLLTLAVRDTALFGPVLITHLAAIAVAFAVAPATKFAHALYRLLAIYKNNLDAARESGRDAAGVAG